jgi:Gram-negative bacterial TonB protein C-terminal
MPLHLLIAIVLLGIASSAVHAQPQAAPRPSYSLRVDQAVPGSLDRTPVAPAAPYPLNKRYEQFTEDEKKILRAYYVSMPDTDDPPFPARGMREIVQQVSTLVGEFDAKGYVTIHVTVNEKGEATSVSLLSYPNLEIAKAIAYVLVKTKYKPASCSGQPCTAEFPFRFKVSNL